MNFFGNLRLVSFIAIVITICMVLCVACCRKGVRVTQSVNSDSEADLQQAVELFLQGKYLDALNVVENEISKHPNDKLAHATKGQILCELGRGKDAIDSFDKANEIDPDYAEAYLHKGFTYMGIGDENASFKAFQYACRAYIKRQSDDPGNYDAAMAIPVTLYFQGKKRDAINEIKKTLVLCGDKEMIKTLNFMKSGMELDEQYHFIPDYVRKLRGESEDTRMSPIKIKIFSPPRDTKIDEKITQESGG